MHFKKQLELLTVKKEGVRCQLILKGDKVLVKKRRHVITTIPVKEQRQDWMKLDSIIQHLVRESFTIEPALEKINVFIDRVVYDVLLNFINTVHLSLYSFLIRNRIGQHMPKERKSYREFTHLTIIEELEDNVTFFITKPELYCEAIVEDTHLCIRRYSSLPYLVDYLKMGIKVRSPNLSWDEITNRERQVIAFIDEKADVLIGGIKRRLSRHGIDVYKGQDNGTVWTIIPTEEFYVKFVAP